MAGVFLSYDREDSDRARQLALALEKAGHEVWWDLHVRGGAQFSKVIEEALKAADAVVVLWSIRSVESAWVRDEAAAGRDSGRLVPVLLDKIDPPLGFRQFQAIDLSGWRGRGKPAELRSLFADIESMTKPGSEARPQSKLGPAVVRPRPKGWPIAIAAAVLVLIAAVAGLKLLRPSNHVPSVAVEASDASTPSKTLARDLLVKLGSLQSSNANAIQLAQAGAGDKPDLVFEVAGNADGSPPHASLVLASGKDRSVYWTREFETAAGRAADLRQQLGFTAARIVGCAAEGLNPKGNRLSPGTLKLYLNACATLAEMIGAEDQPVAGMFRQVTEQAPQFEGGWRGLLLAESEVFTDTSDQQVREQLQRDIAAARKVNPNLIEIVLAELYQLPTNAFAERMRLADKAVELGPDNALAYAERAGVLQSVGRMDDGVQDAQKAVQLDPLSPPRRDNFIAALLYAGRKDIALDELQKAERLWPGASSVREARFRIEARYGDAEEALRTIRADPSRAGWTSMQSFLEARIDPSPAKVEKAIDDARHNLQYYRKYPDVIAHVAQVYGEFGREKELLDILLQAPLAEIIQVTDSIFRPAVREIWKDPRSLLVAKRIGLLQFWNSSGKWPDFCEDRNLSYDCKQEASKLL